MPFLIMAMAPTASTWIPTIRKNTPHVSRKTMSTPARAGPMILVMFMPELLRLMAFIRSPAGTRSDMMELRLGMLKGGKRPVCKPYDHEVPEPDRPGHVEHRQHKGEQGVSGLAHQDDPPAVEPVGQRTSRQGREGQGERKGHHDEGEREGRIVGEPEDEPPPGDLLHGYGHKGQEGPQPQPPEIPVAERMKGRKTRPPPGAPGCVARRVRPPFLYE